ncbi:MFS transporter [Streptomyces sp. NBC_01378]|uniref:MFS transporter n=1 Tax=Streptomyces sp. NBC_01378 TaxID=2903844 RepID=UPI0038662958
MCGWCKAPLRGSSTPGDRHPPGRLRGKDRGRALGLYAVTTGVATALGPLLGGALDAGLGLQLGWRCCLFVSTPWAMLTTVTCFRAPLAAGLCRHPATPPPPEQRSEAR